MGMVHYEICATVQLLQIQTDPESYGSNQPVTNHNIVRFVLCCDLILVDFLMAGVYWVLNHIVLLRKLYENNNNNNNHNKQSNVIDYIFTDILQSCVIATRQSND